VPSKIKYVFILYSCIICFISSCKDDEQLIPEESFVTDFYSNAQSLYIIVGYEEGAKPFHLFKGDTVWRVLDYNLSRLLASKEINTNVPLAIGNMTNLGIREQNNYSRQNIIDLAASIQTKTNKASDKAIVVLFLDGHFIKEGVLLDRVLGLNIDGSAIVAIFKPVILSASNKEASQALVEQSTVTHEIGHVLGLVNNGVRATSAHHDVANGAHCTNSTCVMYWKNGEGEVSQFLNKFESGEDVLMFGGQCIADIAAK